MMKKKKKMRRSKRKINKKKSKQKQGTIFTTPYFPQDIITEILTCLPVKTLLICGCVCKSWLKLISNLIFIKTHISKSNLFNNFTCQRIFLEVGGEYGNYCLDLSSFSRSGKLGYAVQLDFPLERSNLDQFKILGCCNGLLCIGFENFGIVLWNPSTRKSSKQVPFPDRMKFPMMSNLYGLGYDAINDDYKLVWRAAEDIVYGLEGVSVYSFKTGLWKRIENFPYNRCIYYREYGRYVNGVLHWLVTSIHGIKYSMVIVSFDLCNEAYGEIAQPCYGDSRVSSLELGVLEGCLSVFFHVVNIRYDLWVMKEYGVRDTWVKLYTIPYNVGPRFSFFYPLCVCESGEILLKTGGDLYLYNPSNSSFRIANIWNFECDVTGLGAITYVESLVLPNFGDEVLSSQR